MKSILLVDDKADTRAVLGAMLTYEGYAVLEASNGKQALDLLVSETSKEPCLIVLDLGMPVMSGREFLAVARNSSRLAKVPVLVTSGSHERPEALDHDAIIGFLPKPFDFETLLGTIRRLAQGGDDSEAALVHARKAVTA